MASRGKQAALCIVCCLLLGTIITVLARIFGDQIFLPIYIPLTILTTFFGIAGMIQAVMYWDSL